VDGMRQMLWGFFKKIVIADNCAMVVNQIFADYASFKSTSLILGAVLFSIQIYCDFSGYSDIAIGVAKLFGIKLMRNFNNPYFSRDIAEFWRRWHISLTTWFRDYLYIPLGGSRTTKAKVVRNTFVIFLVSGFWHGANWTFVSWGAYHALLFLPLILLGKNRKYTNTVAEGRVLPSVKELFQMISTFILAVLGWVIFRAQSIGQAFDYFRCMWTNWNITKGASSSKILLVGIIVLLLVEWLQREKEHGLEIKKVPLPIRNLIYISILVCCMLYCGQNETFIYFQF
jgi:D-alanyl-lipoteichoic acid acyltransferase DltB (MBOAT superfamily)